jgi:hypothetical protein
LNFFATAQQSTLNAVHELVLLDVWLENGVCETIRIRSDDSLEMVQQKLCDQLQLPTQLRSLFDLFMIQLAKDFDPSKIVEQATIVRQVCPLDSPYLTLSIANRSDNAFRLLWRRFYWNKDGDNLLLGNEIGKQFVCSSVRTFLEQSESQISDDHRKHLDTLRLRKDKREVCATA